MRRMLVVLTMAGAVVGAALAQPRYQMDYRGCIPQDFKIDPNAIVGAVLPPNAGDPNDPNTWAVTAGPWARTGAIYDPDGPDDLRYVDIKLIAGPPDFVGSVDPNAATWSVRATLAAGDQVISLAAINRPPGRSWRTRVVSIVLRAQPKPNLTPVLE